MFFFFFFFLSDKNTSCLFTIVSIISEVSLCFSYFFFHVGSIWHLLVYLRGGGRGLLSFHANFYSGGGGKCPWGGLCPTLAFQGGGVDSGGSFLPSPTLFSFLPPLFSLLLPLVSFLPPLLRVKVWTFTFRRTKLVPVSDFGTKAYQAMSLPNPSSLYFGLKPINCLRRDSFGSCPLHVV